MKSGEQARPEAEGRTHVFSIAEEVNFEGTYTSIFYLMDRESGRVCADCQILAESARTGEAIKFLIYSWTDRGKPEFHLGPDRLLIASDVRGGEIEIIKKFFNVCAIAGLRKMEIGFLLDGDKQTEASCNEIMRRLQKKHLENFGNMLRETVTELNAAIGGRSRANA